MVKTKVLKLTAILKKEQFALTDLIDITFHPDKNICFQGSLDIGESFPAKAGELPG